MKWLRGDVVSAVHKRQVAEHGGRALMRDRKLLDFTLVNPRERSQLEPGADIARLAAAYAFGIVKNHPFLDGNKRTGYVITELFIMKNGYQLKASPTEKYLTFLSLAEGSLSEEELAAWLREKIAAA